MLINKKPSNSYKISRKKLKKFIDKKSLNFTGFDKKKQKDFTPSIKKYNKKKLINHDYVLIEKSF